MSSRSVAHRNQRRNNCRGPNADSDQGTGSRRLPRAGARDERGLCDQRLHQRMAQRHHRLADARWSLGGLGCNRRPAGRSSGPHRRGAVGGEFKHRMGHPTVRFTLGAGSPTRHRRKNVKASTRLGGRAWGCSSILRCWRIRNLPSAFMNAPDGFSCAANLLDGSMGVASTRWSKSLKPQNICSNS